MFPLLAVILFSANSPGLAASRCDEFVTPLGQAIVQEMNLVRQDPPGYAMKLEELLPSYEGLRRKLAPHEYLVTKEGAAAVEEAVRVLKATAPRPALKLEPCLCRSADDHVLDAGPQGRFGHDGSKGETFADRIRRYLRRYRTLGENIDYGSEGARDVVMQLLIDDGVPGRGHRHNILAEDFNRAGAACGPFRPPIEWNSRNGPVKENIAGRSEPHAKLREMCVIDFMGL